MGRNCHDRPRREPRAVGEHEVTAVAHRLSTTNTVTGIKLRVLIVEDDLAVAKLLKTYLEREGYSAAAAETVADMRTAVEADKVDLVLLDVVLPDEDGW